MRTKLEGTGAQKIVIDYLEAEASDMLVEKINKCQKTMDDCWKYITGMAKKRAQNNCACISDQEVFGWAVHFFEEEGNVKETDKVAAVKTVVSRAPEKKVEPKPEKHKVKKTDENEMMAGQITLAELFGGGS